MRCGFLRRNRDGKHLSRIHPFAFPAGVFFLGVQSLTVSDIRKCIFHPSDRYNIALGESIIRFLIFMARTIFSEALLTFRKVKDTCFFGSKPGLSLLRLPRMTDILSVGLSADEIVASANRAARSLNLEWVVTLSSHAMTGFSGNSPAFCFSLNPGFLCHSPAALEL